MKNSWLVNDTGNVCNENKLPNLEENHVASLNSLLYDLCLFLVHYYFLRLKETETVFLVYFFNSILVKKKLESIF